MLVVSKTQIFLLTSQNVTIKSFLISGVNFSEETHYQLITVFYNQILQAFMILQILNTVFQAEYYFTIH